MIKNWLIRGDTHGTFTWMADGRLEGFAPEETAIIILGDVGLNFYLNKSDDRNKKEVNARGYRLYCVRGNHEARPQDLNMELLWDEDVDGEVYWQPEYPNIRYFKDFGIYNVGGYSAAVIGGAYSVDKAMRIARDPINQDPKKTGWFPNEQLSIEEMLAATNLLRDRHYNFVLTHTCPVDWEPTDLFYATTNQSTVDKSMELFLSDLAKKINWDVWCFGHYHADRIERPYVQQFFNCIESLDGVWFRWEKYDSTGQLDWWLPKSPQFYWD